MPSLQGRALRLLQEALISVHGVCHSPGHSLLCVLFIRLVLGWGILTLNQPKGEHPRGPPAEEGYTVPTLVQVTSS